MSTIKHNTSVVYARRDIVLRTIRVTLLCTVEKIIYKCKNLFLSSDCVCVRACVRTCVCCVRARVFMCERVCERA